MSKKVAEFYDNFAESQFESGIHHRHLAIMQWLQKFGMPKSGNFLEIGCGVGTQTELILRYLNLDATVTAVDISIKSIEHAKRRLVKYANLTLIAGDIIDLNLNEKFDVIVLPDVLEHIPLELHNNLFKKLSYLLAPSGFMMIHIPHPNYLEWITSNRPEQLQIIDNPIYTNNLLGHAYKYGLYLVYLESYSIFTEPEDYQVIVLKNKLVEGYRSVKARTFQSLVNRAQRKIKLIIRGR